ncbi:MAG: metallopeptidase family protein, partial [Planctomycetota bacterium]
IPSTVHILGFYHGVPVSKRSKDDTWRLPDEIYIFQESIEKVCTGDEAVRKEIRQTVWHEIAHHFGFDEKEIDEWERY